MSTPPRSTLEPCTVNLIPCLSRLPSAAVIKPCSVQLDAQAVSKYFTSVALASRSSRDLESTPTVSSVGDSPQHEDEKTSEEPDGQEKGLEEIVILDSPKKASAEEIIEISDSEDSVVEVETVPASKKKDISVPAREPVPVLSRTRKIYEQVRYLCPKCKKHYVNKSAVSSHYAKAHNGSLRHNNIQEEVKIVYECLICSVSFFNLINFQIHCDSIHSISIPVSELIVSPRIETSVKKENATLQVVSSKTDIPVEKGSLPVVSSKTDIPVEKGNLPVVSQKVEQPIQNEEPVSPPPSIDRENKDCDTTALVSDEKETCVTPIKSDMEVDTASTSSSPADQQTSPKVNSTIKNVVDVQHHCEKCDTTYISMDELALHHKKFHLRQRKVEPTQTQQSELKADKYETDKYECSECNQMFSSELERNNHCKLAHDIPQQQTRDQLCCKYCKKFQYFTDVADFFFHLKKVHANIFENIVKQSDTLQQDGVSECQSLVVGDNSRESDSAVENVGSNLEFDVVKDSIPPVVTGVFKPGSTVPKEERFRCTTCHKNFAHKQSLFKHIRCFHDKTKQYYIVRINEDTIDKYMCLICEKRFRTRNGASVHYGSIHDKSLTQETPQTQRYIVSTSGMFVCTICHEFFGTKIRANVHYNKVHSFSDKPVAQVMPQVNDLLNPIEPDNSQNSTGKPSQSLTMPFETVFIQSLEPSDIAKKRACIPVINNQKTVNSTAMSSLPCSQTFEKFKCLNCFQQFDTNIALANHHCSEQLQNTSVQREPNAVCVCQHCGQDFQTDLKVVQETFCSACKLAFENEVPGTSNDRFDDGSDLIDSKVDIVDHNTSENQSQAEATKARNHETLRSIIFQCDKCCRMFINRLGLSEHVCKTRNPLSYRYEHENIPCIYCEDLCANIYQAVEHRRQKHCYVCFICKIDFKSEYALNTHDPSHVHYKTFHQCSLCNRNFKTVEECISHIQSSYNISSSKSAMELCKAVKCGTQNKPKLLDHIFCPFCELKFKSFSILNYHFIRKHQMLQCLTCDNYFIFNHANDTQCKKCSKLTSDASKQEKSLALEQESDCSGHTSVIAGPAHHPTSNGLVEQSADRLLASTSESTGDKQGHTSVIAGPAHHPTSNGLVEQSADRLLASTSESTGDKQEHTSVIAGPAHHPTSNGLVEPSADRLLASTSESTGDKQGHTSVIAGPAHHPTSNGLVEQSADRLLASTSESTGDKQEHTKKRKQEEMAEKTHEDSNEGCCRTRGVGNWQLRKKMKSEAVKESQENESELTDSSDPPLINKATVCITCQNPMTPGDKCNVCSPDDVAQPLTTEANVCIKCQNPMTPGDNCEFCSTDVAQPLATEANVCIKCQNPMTPGDNCELCSTDVAQPLATEANVCIKCQNPMTPGDNCELCSTDVAQPLTTEPNVCIKCQNPMTPGDKCNVCSPDDVAQPLATEPNVPDTSQNIVISDVKSIADDMPTPVAMHRVIKICTTCSKLVSSGDKCQFCSGNASKSYDITVSQSQDSPASESYKIPTSELCESPTLKPQNIPVSKYGISISKAPITLASKSHEIPASHKCKTCGNLIKLGGDCLSCRTRLQCPPLAVPSPDSTTSKPSSSAVNSSIPPIQRSFKILGFQCSRCRMWVPGIHDLRNHLKDAHNVNMKISLGTGKNNS